MMNEIIIELTKRGFKTINVQDVYKNNVKLTGISVSKNENSKCTATFYKSPEWEQMNIEEICDYIETNYDKGSMNDELYFTDQINDLCNNPEFIKDKSYICIQSKGENEMIVKKDYLDLEAYIRVYISEGASFILSKELYKGEDIWEIAFKNTKDTFKVYSMSDIFVEILFAKNGGDINDLDPEEYQHIKESIFNTFLGGMDETEVMYVVSTKSKSYGAGALYFPEVFQKFCQEQNVGGCYIIPSSIHELILIKDDKDVDEEQLTDMIGSVNTTEVSPFEVLSTHNYYYNLETNAVYISKEAFEAINS